MKSEKGFALIGVIVLLSLALVLSAGMLDSANANLQTRTLVKTSAENYYQTEETLNKVLAWMDQNSESLAFPFLAANFNSSFDVNAAPVAGSNESTNFAVPGMLKLDSSTNSAMLVSNALFGTAAFPNTQHIVSGAPFNPITSFQSADLGETNARVVLLWSQATNGAQEPVFRVDMVTGDNADRGNHSFAYVYGKVVGGGGLPGFYGQDWLSLHNPKNDCASYHYGYASPGNWTQGAKRANCSLGSNGVISIAATVEGKAESLAVGGVTLGQPAGELIGTECEGGSCHTYALPSLDMWSDYCVSSAPDYTISSNTSWASGGCYRDVVINSNQTLVLTDYNNPYYIRSIDFSASGARLSIGDIPNGESVEVYFEVLTSGGTDHITGAKIVNIQNAPHQLELFYLEDEELRVGGSADVGALIIAPDAQVTVDGDFSFNGGIRAEQLFITGSSKINYDESLNTSNTITDMTFSIKRSSQRYR